MGKMSPIQNAEDETRIENPYQYEFSSIRHGKGYGIIDIKTSTH